MSSHHSHRRFQKRGKDASIGSWAGIEAMPCSADKPRKSRLTLCQETKGFIIACEALRQHLEDNGLLTGEEKDLIEFSALELLNRVKPLD
jgi:hypothetical protein